QPMTGRNGSMTLVASSRPLRDRMPYPAPIRSIISQSRGCWFQPAMETSSMPREISATPIRQTSRLSGGSVGTGPDLEARGLVQTRHGPFDPVGHPLQHLLERHLRIAHERKSPARIAQPGGGRLFAHEAWRAAEPAAEPLGKAADRQRLRTGNIEGCRRAGAVQQAA